MYPRYGSRYKYASEEDEETIYSKKSRERMVEEDNLNHEEDWVMEGYEEALPELEEEDELTEDFLSEPRDELYF